MGDQPLSLRALQARLAVSVATGEATANLAQAILEDTIFNHLGHVPGDWHKPDWESGSGVHEWKAYISEELQVLWPTLSPVVQRILARDADVLAGQEEYD